MDLYTERPQWLVNAVEAQFPRKHLIGATKRDIGEFIKHVQATLLSIEPMREKGRNIVDINSKEIQNSSNIKDQYDINTVKCIGDISTKNYKLVLGNNRIFGEDFGIGIDSSFFNIDVGVSASREKTQNDDTTETSDTRSLSQEYGVVDTITVPRHSKAHVTITTYAVTYSANVRVKFSAPKHTFVRVMVQSFGCCGGKRQFRQVNASDYLHLHRINPTSRIQEQNGWVSIETDANVQYNINKINSNNNKHKCVRELASICSYRTCYQKKWITTTQTKNYYVLLVFIKCIVPSND